LLFCPRSLWLSAIASAPFKYPGQKESTHSDPFLPFSAVLDPPPGFVQISFIPNGPFLRSFLALGSFLSKLRLTGLPFPMLLGGPFNSPNLQLVHSRGSPSVPSIVSTRPSPNFANTRKDPQLARRPHCYTTPLWPSLGLSCVPEFLPLDFFAL